MLHNSIIRLQHINKKGHLQSQVTLSLCYKKDTRYNGKTINDENTSQIKSQHFFSVKVSVNSKSQRKLSFVDFVLCSAAFANRL